MPTEELRKTGDCINYRRQNDTHISEFRQEVAARLSTVDAEVKNLTSWTNELNSNLKETSYQLIVLSTQFKGLTEALESEREQVRAKREQVIHAVNSLEEFKTVFEPQLIEVRNLLYNAAGVCKFFAAIRRVMLWGTAAAGFVAVVINYFSGD